MTATTVTGPAALRLLGDDRRWRLLQELARTDARVGELVQRIGSPQNLVSYHLAQLRRAGIVSTRRSTADGRDTYYRLEVQRCGELLATAGAQLTPSLHLTRRRGPRRFTGPPRRVLFLCTGNSARSQMAEALAVHLSDGAVQARSAGSHPKPVHPYAVQVMAERGIDISTATSRHLDEVVDHPVDRVITLCDKVREVCPELPGATASHWSTPNPADAEEADRYDAFARTAAELEDRVGVLLDELSTPADEEDPDGR
ncbi:metalloregulator ArsR/SmtB family transcription factor [Euzebya sp.]|uniref:metalloregulator ArsR/SmtB family transcription factor n=1 Tax=Euzebya sp. TaxID=1971409 RepID=UPI003513FCF8